MNCSVAWRTIWTRLAGAACASSGPAAARVLSSPKRRMHVVDLWMSVVVVVVIGFSLRIRFVISLQSTWSSGHGPAIQLGNLATPTGREAMLGASIAPQSFLHP